MKLTDDIRSVTDLKRKTREILDQVRRTGRPVILTVNGKADAVLMDAKTFETRLAAGNLARELGMSSEKVDEMMHAVIEACINAREHGYCADNRIYLRFVGTSQGEGRRIDAP